MRRNWKEIVSIAASAGLALGVFLGLLAGLGWNLLLCMGLALASYPGFLLVLRPVKKIGRIEVETIGNGELLHERLQEAGSDYRRMRKAADKILDPVLKRDVQSLLATAESILKFLTDNPKKISSARRYIDYYQETAANVLENYVELQDSRLATREAQKILQNTAEAVATLKGAFQMQFEKLLQNELMDMEADLNLLKQTLRSEGYTEISKERKQGKRMKKKIIGLIVLACVMGVIGGIDLLTGGTGDLGGENQEEKQTEREDGPAVQVSGYIGGEKAGFLEDEEVLEILRKDYGLEVDYSKAGSLDMMTADLTGRNYLFPSSSIALEYYEELHGSPKQSEIILNTPIVLYTHKIVLEAFEQQGMITKDEDVNYVDMNKLLELIRTDTKWTDIGVPELYGSVSVDTTDPAKSNSGNMFAALLADVLNGGQTLTPESVDEVLPELQAIFGKLGYMETSSADLFSQFLPDGSRGDTYRRRL